MKKSTKNFENSNRGSISETSLDFNYVKPCLDLTLTFSKTKLSDHDKNNW